MLKRFVMTISLILGFNLSFADVCSFDVEATDQMNYNTKEIIIPNSCKNFTINLINKGKMPKSAMGHNIIISKADDVKKIIADGLKSGIAQNYVKLNDNRIVAHTKLIGSGEKTSITFPVEKIKDGNYVAFCSFPAHETKMHIKLSVR